MAPLTKEQFHAIITKAAKHRTSAYDYCASLSVFWEHNDVSAAADVHNFQQMLSTLNLPAAEELTIQSDDHTPGWTLQARTRAILKRAKDAPGRALVLLHYTGHAYPLNDILWAQENNQRNSSRMSLDRYFLSHSDGEETLFTDADAVDVVYVLDCCYAHKALKALSTDSRLVEVIAATDANMPGALGYPRDTLTGKLRGEIARRICDGHKYVEVADLIQTLRANSPVVKPSHGLRKGIGSVCLPLTGLAQTDPKTLSPSLRALFSVHVTDDMSPKQIEELVIWIGSLPPAFQISLDGVYQTQ
ncbi:hypothetical protein N7468_001203 [Penicillium chermesinum]|uniref:Caspase domain-containing protein n=1 Tax=Penicillium chermesinum TaxID=63820 RepID=A0A9W9TWJ6_9EURO|nr:uncharacterized protein N7468_001203 [Penicillium chermesinum]KAJ5246220.1 hypothetical protein N7468_001203 [Penicillium chermesinum]KAJ6144507.1 hypothetical protein N7470_008402 [Penicillium chermesinum]